MRFVASAQQNAEQLRKCREQYQHLLREQNKDLPEGKPIATELSFDTIRDMLKDTTGLAEM